MVKTSFTVMLDGAGEYTRLRYELMDFIEYMLREMYAHERVDEPAPTVSFHASVNISEKGE